tara:strand:- start:1204 stop:1374 length:171 start_codon:yes stop_codon:yes gene_type:complete
MIEIIMYWILSNANTPVFIWFLYSLHIAAIALKGLSFAIKSIGKVDLKDIGKDEEF